MVFSNPRAEAQISKLIQEIPPPGNLMGYYDEVARTIYIIVAKRESLQHEAELLSWFAKGPVSLDEAKLEVQRLADISSEFVCRKNRTIN